MKVVALLFLLAVGAYSQSCVGRCGENNAAEPCQCNSVCSNFGDCCSDYDTVCFTCQDRCGEAYSPSKPCQCNSECSNFGNCCVDYSEICGGTGGTVTDDDLRTLTETLFGADINNVGSQLTLDHGGQGTSGDLAPGPYFVDVPASALTGPTISAIITLQDNYIPDVGVAEVEDAAEVAEIEAFLDAVMATEVMTISEAFLVDNGVYTANLRDKIREMWFDMYSRSSGILGSSGFEHTFVGELKSGVSGFHNWVYFYQEEQNGNLNYEGWSALVDLGSQGEVIEYHFTWLNNAKPIGGMFTGTSPELELAVYTVCFLARPDSLCPVQMNGVQFQIQTWTLAYNGKTLVGVYSQSCVGRCGENNSAEPCQCNALCTDYGDCCSDYNPVCFSCQDRCGEAYLHSKPCQCNNECNSHGNCCSDYNDLCDDAKLRELTEALLAADVNNVGSQLTIDHGGQGSSGDLAPGPYFVDVPASALSGPTISALIALQNNYVPEVSVAEVEDASEVAEIEAFLDAIMATEVMQLAESFLVDNSVFTGNLRDRIREMWFDFYSRSGGTLGSSGFEHVLVGELKGGVSGFHNWVYFYHEEKNGNLNYEGYNKVVDLGDKGEIVEDHFTWLNNAKPIGGMFTGTSPELDLAVYTVCFLARPDSLCPVQMNGVQFQVQTWTLDYNGKVLVGSAYPKI
ncbi:hypothetical protein SK128_001848 [Halocaridina rubra]|uniref:Uncharacterized protein n=1 Tax=Halocaridina rubra TaxID=373956 RepID=A0AAN9A950_HALRR